MKYNFFLSMTGLCALICIVSCQPTTLSTGDSSIPLDQWPEPMTRSFGKMNQSLYVTMQGPSEFGIAGNLVNWDRKAQLPSLSIPILTIGAKYDTMDPEFMKWMSTQVQNGSFLSCPNGSHMDMWDDQQVYMTGLIKWLKETNAGAKKVSL